MKRAFAAICASGLILAVIVAPHTFASSSKLLSRTSQGRSIGIVHRVLHPRVRALRNYWTPRRMMNVKPVPLSNAVHKSEPTRIQQLREHWQRPFMRSASRSIAAPSRPLSSSGATAVPVNSSTYTAYPYRTWGQINIQASTGNWGCSGTVVTSDNRSVVWTAGHCVSNPEMGTIYSWTFVPAYQAGSAPFGKWPVVKWWAPNAWLNYRDNGYDMAALIVAQRSDGTRLADVVGSEGFATGLDPGQQTFTARGYPIADPFDGEHMWECVSPRVATDTSESPATTGIACDMTGGSSGGGWATSDGYVNSETSYGYDNQPNLLYGPYFGSSAQQLYEDASTDPVLGNPTPVPTPTVPTTQVVTHYDALSLNFRGHLTAWGHVIASDGYLPCRRNALVGLYRKVNGEWTLLRKTFTDNAGFYSIHVRDRRGSYVTYAPRGTVNDTNDCAEATSSIRRR